MRLISVVSLSGLAISLVIGCRPQDLPAVWPAPRGTSPIEPAMLGSGGHESFPTTSTSVSRNAPFGDITPAGKEPLALRGIQRITLEQVTQSANRAISPLQRLNLLAVEAARQHRLAVRADYFPKFGANLLNVHYTEFPGQILQVRRPLLGVTQDVPVPVVNQNQTVAALTLVQPITPIFEVNQAVKIARADERIQMAKAGAAATKNTHNAEIEETYFQLLIAQRQWNWQCPNR